MSLGKTVGQLLSEIDSAELSEWAAYYELEPFGEWRADLRAGIVASTVHNAFRGKGQPRAKPKDYMPDFEALRPKEAMTREELIHAAKRMALQLGGTVQ